MTHRPILQFIQQHGNVRVSAIARSCDLQFAEAQNTVRHLSQIGVVELVRVCTLLEAQEYRLTPRGLAGLKEELEEKAEVVG